ncbi:DUF2752 domain-containing protein [Crateriforma conspicua]|uniref:DUF2752 domain-containing protein n=1 Tax=Crateriforma conspicua TaxID=2527996 RepID=A0A5C5Y5T7_9PLAN|nr:DUF2752 domain-containing protein [Crateriforma conspicua]QDV64624.1 hypothetical protein Mal65_37850 [Crateriforma conspicua]TWT70021.1 hypothetical protein Pan14r_23190 [Crateriforma conspicua]
MTSRPQTPDGLSHPPRPGAQATVDRPFPLSIPARLVAAVAAGVPLVLLLIASTLQPSSEGLGTHRQLGLPPCSTRILLGVRCPACGMTTSWSHFTHGQWASSLAVNSGGFFLAVFALIFSGVAIGVAWRGRLPRPEWIRVLGWSAVGIAVLTLVDWAIRLASEAGA